MKPPKEQAEQIALVARCRKEDILTAGTENSLGFPLPALLAFIKQFATVYWLKRVEVFLIQLISQLTKKRIAMGMLVGYPDLFFPELHLYIEMKRQKGGVLSEEQKAVHERLRRAGYTVIVPKGAKEAWESIEKLATERKVTSK